MVFRIDCNIPGEMIQHVRTRVCPQALYFHYFVFFTKQTSSLYEMSTISAQNSITVL